MPPKIQDMSEDHWTYITIYQRAYNTDAKWKAIQQRQMALKMSGQAEPQQPMQQGNKAMSNMMVNDMLQQSNKAQNGAKSLASITQ